MDNNLYRRIVQYARVIAGGDDLPWSGLYTARSVYNLLKNSEPLYPEDIGAQLDLSAEYVNQIILALLNGAIIKWQRWGNCNGGTHKIQLVGRT